MLGELLTDFGLKYENSENVKADHVNTVIFNLHQIKRQAFFFFGISGVDTDDMKGDDGWKKIIDLLKKHYSKDDNTAALETWKEFRNFTRSDQSID